MSCRSEPGSSSRGAGRSPAMSGGQGIQCLMTRSEYVRKSKIRNPKLPVNAPGGLRPPLAGGMALLVSGGLHGAPQDSLDAGGERGPFLFAGGEGFLAGEGELVVFTPAAVDFAPEGREQFLPFQPVQGRVQASLFELEVAARPAADRLRDFIPVGGAVRDDFQNEHLDRSPEQSRVHMPSSVG